MPKITNRPPSTAAIIEIREALGKPPMTIPDEASLRSEIGHTAVVAASPDPDVVFVADIPKGTHALDSAPINSKVVRTETQAVLAGPDGATALPKTDPMMALPEGAKITKKADGVYLATQLSPAVDHPDMTYTTASEAIKDFLRHFHEVKPA